MNYDNILLDLTSKILAGMYASNPTFWPAPEIAMRTLAQAAIKQAKILIEELEAEENV